MSSDGEILWWLEKGIDIVQPKLSVTDKTTRFFVFLFGVFLIVFAGFRSPGFDADSLNYIGVIHAPISDMSFLDKEPSFWIVVILNQLLFSSSYISFFMIYAMLGVSLKLYAIKTLLKDGFLFSLVIYLLLYYVLHELTQIRVGVASALFLLSLKDVLERRPA